MGYDGYFGRFGNVVKGKTFLESCGLSGDVKHITQTIYKVRNLAGTIVKGKVDEDSFEENYIHSFNEKGTRIKRQSYSGSGYKTSHFNEQGQSTECVQYDVSGNMTQITTSQYNQFGKCIGSEARKADGSIIYKSIQKYDEEGRNIENITYHGDELKLTHRTLYGFDEKGNYISCHQYKENNELTSIYLVKYDEDGKETEAITESFLQRDRDDYRKVVTVYNEHGDSIKQIVYNRDGRAINTYPITRKYDSNGKLIPRKIDPDHKDEGVTYKDEKDVKGNWIKRTVFYLKIPQNIVIREFVYFEDNIEKPKHHPMSIATTGETGLMDITSEISEADARWIAKETLKTPDNFSNLRYYVSQFKEVPSVLTFNHPKIEAIGILNEVKQHFSAQFINTSTKVTSDHHEQLLRYSLTFPAHPGYLLHAIGMTRTAKQTLIVPILLKLNPDDQIYISQLQLLRPPEGSALSDDNFEEDLNDYVKKCCLSKKPDKPYIYLIQTHGSSYVMKDQPVEDNFSIRDLDVNYGQGFSDFHRQVMERFSNGTKGLVLFHGKPGTGKTYYIRYLLRRMSAANKVVIYMPPNMVDSMGQPEFMTFLLKNIRYWTRSDIFCVLLIEDAEPLLVKRQSDIRIQGITNLLNLTDGILNDFLNLQIICTFNTELNNIDDALLRPGRLIARKEFTALSEFDTNLLAHRLGIKHHFTKGATLAEIYAMQKDKNILM